VCFIDFCWRTFDLYWLSIDVYCLLNISYYVFIDLWWRTFDVYWLCIDLYCLLIDLSWLFIDCCWSSFYSIVVSLIFINFLYILYIILMVRGGGHKYGIWSVRRREAKLIDFDRFWIGFHYASGQRSEIGHIRRKTSGSKDHWFS